MAERRRPGFREGASFQRGELGQTREVQASVAKTHFSQLLDEVERGATIVILRHGRPVARIVPDDQDRQEEIREAIENIEKLSKERTKRFGRMTAEEILSLRHEGHKY
jgi:prevent-host-death family protein